MLFRMYTRWAERAGFKAEVLDLSEGEEAGIKSVTIEITGEHAYGYAKAERGVHRLVRLSPFDSAHARHTSFALVEVLPESEGDVDVQINPDDLKIDVFKASGAGGQHVQKNSTAIRITHRPSGLVVTCQNERSQLQNKEVALRILRSRLMEIAIRERLEERAKLKGDHIAAGWGNQIRSYVLHPYKMVKDHRSGFESTNPELVLDGELKPLMKAYLLSSVEGE
jgi:peptide chain release factor 2